MKRGPILFALLLFLGIAVVASLPTQDKFALHTQGPLHPWFHLLAFGTLTFVLLTTVRSPLARVLVVILMLTFGWGTEFVEHLRDSWPVETGDVLLDSAGVVAGAVAAMLRLL